MFSDMELGMKVFLLVIGGLAIFYGGRNLFKDRHDGGNNNGNSNNNNNNNNGSGGQV